MPWKWPWQTKEDEVIRLLNAELDRASTIRAESAAITKNARREAERRINAERGRQAR